MHGIPALVLCCAAATATGAESAASPFAMCSRLESRIAAGDGVTLPDADRELVRFAGTADLADGDWPGEFLARAGRTVCVAVSPHTGCYEFFDESGDVFWTVVPVLPTTDNWVAPFRHAEGRTHPDDDLYAPWRLVDVWLLSHAESAEFAEFSGRARPPGAPRLESRAENAVFFDFDLPFVDNCGQLRFVNNPDPTNLCFTAFSFSETNIFFTAAWPTNEPPPGSVLDLYVSTNLSSRWSILSSHPATNPPVSFSVERSSVPGYVATAYHVHDATCESITNVVSSPLDGTTVYTNVFWSCSTNREPAETAFFRLGTRHDTDGDGLLDASEILVLGTDPHRLDSDGDGVPDGVSPADWWINPIWATNGEDADFIVDLVAPTDRSAETILTMDSLRIPLSPNAGPWNFRLPRGRVVPCSASSSGSFFILWCGAPGGSFWAPDPTFENPLWTDGIGNVSGYHTDPGSCSLAVPVLTVEPVFPPEDSTNAVAGTGSHLTESGSVCVHEADGILRYSWNVAPAIVGQGRQPVATGSMHVDSTGLYADVSGTFGDQTGTVTLADGPRSGAGDLHKSPSTGVTNHLCDATYSNPYCSVCGTYEGTDLTVSIDGLSERTLTLKHDNVALFSLDHPNSFGESFQTARFEINQPGHTGWISLTGTTWTARIAGLFFVRAIAETSNGRIIRTNPFRIVVQFPSEDEMIADSTIATLATNVWNEMLGIFTPTSRCEIGCWIQLDTAMDTYLFTTNRIGPPAENNIASTVDLQPLDPDFPDYPNLTHGSAIYTVASFHVHTPATYITPSNCPVGPSGQDQDVSIQFSRPGLLGDYEATLPPVAPGLNGRIPSGHPANAAWQLYSTEVLPRRPLSTIQ